MLQGVPKTVFRQWVSVLRSQYRYSSPMGNLGTDTPPLVSIPGELTKGYRYLYSGIDTWVYQQRGYRYPYSGIDTWCITRGTNTLPSRYRYPNSSVGFGYRYH
ncbi:hypothetical protein V6N11_033358 [Hibiscus sabdariffa]|uniref:Uncharacterized protein n=1 Tax=Hibiscus sabdariffa TaxID=183260 RepID=A0ABR2PYC8_9ROSI